MFGEMMQGYGAGNYADRLAPVLREAHRDFKFFLKTTKMQCAQPRFTPSRLNRKFQTSYLAC